MESAEATPSAGTPRDITLLEQVKIQAQVLVPVLRALRDELGRERADELVSEALRSWSRNLFEQIADGGEDG